MLKYFKSKILSWFLGKDIEEQLKNAKSDAEQVKILMGVIGTRAEEMAKLTEENERLKRELEENDSLFSSGSSLSSGSINSRIEQRKKEIQGLINNSKKPTTHLRKEIKLLNKIQELEEANQLKDLEITELKKEQKENIPANSINTERLGKSVERLQALILDQNKK